jgi:hypothetical protein
MIGNVFGQEFRQVDLREKVLEKQNHRLIVIGY